MKKTILVLAVCTLLPATVFGDLITNSSQDAAGFTQTTLLAGATVYDFDSSTPAINQNGYANGAVVGPGSSDGFYASPYDAAQGGFDATKYFTVPLNSAATPQSSEITFGADYNYLGLFWGSIDSYNKIEFLNGGVVLASHTVTGDDIVAPPEGGPANQMDPDYNRYVNIFLDGATFDAIRITSEQYAFEFDNLAVAVVPVPGAVLLGMLGLAAAGRKLRKMC